MSKRTKKLRIVAYGYDTLGFDLPTSAVRVGDNAEVEFLPFQSNGSLDTGVRVQFSSVIVQKLWNYCNILRDDGMSYLLARPVCLSGPGRHAGKR